MLALLSLYLRTKQNTTCIVITLEKRLDISGHLVSGSIDEMQQFPDRMKGCYQIIVEPFDPDLMELLTKAFHEGTGPDVRLDTSEVYRGKDQLIMETIRKPYAPDFPNEGEPYPGTSLKVTVFPELKFSGDHSVAYPQLSIVGVDKYLSPEQLIDWDSVPDTGYNF